MKKKDNQIKIGILLNYLNMGIGTMIPMVYTPIMLSILEQSEYGLYQLSSSVTSYLGLISMGLGSAMSRYLIKAQTEEGKEYEENTLGLFTRIFRVLAAIAFVVGCVLTLMLHIWYGESLNAEELFRMRIIVFIMVCNTTLCFLNAPYISVVGAHEQFIFQQSMNILSTCILPMFNLVALLLGFASIGMAMSSLIITVLSRVLYSVYTRHPMKISPRYDRMPTHLFHEIFVFSFWIFVANIVGQLYNTTDIVMIGALPSLGTKGVAVYNVGTTFATMMGTLTIGISSLLSPRTSRMVFAGASNAELTDLAIKVGRIQGYIVTLIVSGFLAFGRPFIHFYAGDVYKDAYIIAVILMIPNLIPLVQSVFISIITAQNKHKFRSLTYLGIAVSNVIGTWFLMQTSLGVIGAALMTGIAILCGQGVVMNWYYTVKIKMEMKRFWRSLGKLYVIPVIMCILTLLMSEVINFYSIPRLFAGIILYTIIYCLASWLLVMNPYEKELLLAPLKKIQGRVTRK